MYDSISFDNCIYLCNQSRYWTFPSPSSSVLAPGSISITHKQPQFWSPLSYFKYVGSWIWYKSYNMYSTKEFLNVTLKETKPVHVTVSWHCWHYCWHCCQYYVTCNFSPITNMFLLTFVCILPQLIPYFFKFFTCIRIGTAKEIKVHKISQVKVSNGKSPSLLTEYVNHDGHFQNYLNLYNAIKGIRQFGTLLKK